MDPQEISRAYLRPQVTRPLPRGHIDLAALNDNAPTSAAGRLLGLSPWVWTAASAVAALCWIAEVVR